MPAAPEVLAVFGPTASGKSAVAEELAGRLSTEVVSADAMQVYRGLPILTNHPARPTRLVAFAELSAEMSVGEYERLAHAAIDELVAERGQAVVAGGTGLYFRAALADLDLPPSVPPEARARWEAAYDADPEAAYDELERRDPDAAALVHRNDRRRVVRALELAETGSSLATAHDRLWDVKTRRPTLVAGLEVPAEVLARRIAERTDEMFRRGVVEEVQRALRNGGISATAERALGLHEIGHLERGAARDEIVRRTVKYAAYQRKWMRRIPDVVMIDADRPPDEVADEILEVAGTR
jgi:tRNA dimethylallyltransferase